MAGHRGFTLIETVLVVVIIGLLMTLMMPGLSGVRARGLETKTLSNLRSSGSLVMLYAGDWRERFPISRSPTLEDREVGCGGVVRRLSGRFYFFNADDWYVALCGGYYEPGGTAGLRPAERSLHSPTGVPEAFKMPCAFFASPEFWDLASRTGSGQFRGTAVPEVAYPGGKMMLVSVYWLREGLSTPRPRWGRDWGSWSRTPGVMVDLSVRTPELSDFREPVRSGEGLYPGWVHQQDLGEYPGYHTEWGVRGVDLDY
ncbi:MAG: type II secretion system protein [Phycisphaeraceae bacterium]|nr:MAG: type II secretion system protein [Phycisphaeraceae bacterium]